MQDRIEEALENSSEGGEDYPEQDRMEAKEKARYREDNEDRKTVKIEMGRQKPPLSHGTARSGDITGRSTGDIEKGDSGQNATANSSLKSKLNLHNRKKQVQLSHNVKQELPSSSFTAHTGHSLQPQTSAFASTNSAQTPLPANKTAPQEFQVFIEVETGYSFWAFLCSPSIQLWKKLSNIFFFIIFILSLVFSILDLVVYTESSCSLSALTTIVYYIYFILAALLKISFYIFLQLEIHGKIQYSWKIPHLIPLVLALQTPGLQVGIYSFNYKKCESVSVLFTTREQSEMLSTRLFITFLVYAGLYILSAILSCG